MRKRALRGVVLAAVWLSGSVTATVAAEPVLLFDFKSEKLALGTGDVTDAQPSFDANSQPAVNVSLSPAAGRAFALLTGRHVGETMDLVVCGAVLVSPVIQSQIDGGQIQISGAMTAQEATVLAITLKSGGCSVPQ